MKRIVTGTEEGGSENTQVNFKVPPTQKVGGFLEKGGVFYGE